MSVLGTGIIPSGATGTELTAITRRAFIPRLVVQVYQATPILSAALANAQTASGGISSVTVPVQGSPLTTAQSTDYGGSFSAPTGLNGIQEAAFNLKAIVVPIPFLGMEGLVQLNAAVIPLIEARMNDAGNQIADYASTKLWTNNADNNDIAGFPQICSTTLEYGGLDPADHTWWVGGTRAASSANPTRNTVLQDIVTAAKLNGGEMPNIGACAPGTWLRLTQDFLQYERFLINPGNGFDAETQGPRSAFRALEVAGVPIYIDPYATEGEITYFNTRYFSFYIHEAAAFTFTGFASTLPNMQLGYIGALVAVLEAVCVKRKSMYRTTGYDYTVVTS